CSRSSNLVFHALRPSIKTLVHLLWSGRGFIYFISTLQVILKGGIGRAGSTVANTRVIAPIFHIGSVILLAFLIAWVKNGGLPEEPNIYILAFGMLSAKITNKLVVAHMTKSSMDLWDVAFLGPGFLLLDQYLDSFFPEKYILYLFLIWNTLDLIRYSTSICNQICKHLNIYCFDIVTKRPSNHSNSQVTTKLSQ
ncbi:putative cholinephosphotransferase 1, partial [Apostichopus japonicus]